MTEELKPCPWCEEVPEIHYCLNALGMVEKYSISCKNHVFLFSGRTKEEVTSAWNTRHESNELPEWLVDSVKTRIAELQNSCDHYREHPTAQDLIYISSFVIRELFSILEMRKPEEHE